jgi:hypothetical protein
MTSDDAPELTDELAMVRWAQMAPVIDNVLNRTQDTVDLVAGAGSQLADDDADSDPHNVSRCARTCINVGVDHLHAAKTLILEVSTVLHANADYSLIRGALENFGTAFWVLHPRQRSVRVERALRCATQNFKDEDNAVGDLGLPNYTPAEVNIEAVVAIAEKAGCSTEKLRSGYTSTAVLKYAEKHLKAIDPYLMWQVCSGFAHGRRWATITMNAMEVIQMDNVTATSVPGEKTARFTADHKRLLLAAWPAYQLMNAAVALFDGRAHAY